MRRPRGLPLDRATSFFLFLFFIQKKAEISGGSRGSKLFGDVVIQSHAVGHVKENEHVFIKGQASPLSWRGRLLWLGSCW